MPRLDTFREKYSLESSPLYGMRSRKKLAALLNWTQGAKDLDTFAADAKNYRVFSIARDGKPSREVQEPKERMQALHRRLASLLLRIRPPDYLQSGLRERSFVTNGARHANGMPAIKLDIKKFYPSTKWDHVYRFFNTSMKCAPDVAGLLASLACFGKDQRHLPTGSCLSQILAFYSHKQMFDEIDRIAKARAGVFTLYVDDMVLSMPDASPADIRRIGRLVTRQGLKWHKESFYRKGAPKSVTGTIVKASRLQANKRQFYKLHAALAALRAGCESPLKRLAAARRARGLAQSIAQIDLRHVGRSRGLSGWIKHHLPRDTQM
jgi:hypothetical protein